MMKRMFLTMTVALPLFACSGDSPTESTPVGPPLLSLQTTQVSGRVVLPSDSSLRAQDLRVVNYVASAVPAADGAFTLEAFTGGPQLAVALSSSGPVLLGFIDAAHPELSAQSTAVVLAYFTLGGYAHSGEMQVKLFELLGGWTELKILTDAVAAAVVKSSDPFPANDAGVTAALTKLLETAAAGKRQGQSLRVEPSGKRGGITLDTSVGINTIRLINEYRRRNYVWVDRLYYVSESGAKTSSEKAIAEFAGPMAVGTTSFMGSLVDISQGRMGYSPVTGDTVALPVDPDGAQLTHYRMTMVAVGRKPGDFDKLTAAQKQKLEEISIESAEKDFLLPMVLNAALPLSKDYIDKDLFSMGKGFTGALKDSFGMIRTKVPSFESKAASGDLEGALKDAGLAIASTGTLRTYVIETLGNFVQKAGVTGASKFAEDLAKGVGKYLMGADIALTAWDVGVQVAHSFSERAMIWEIDALPPKVSIEPAQAKIRALGKQLLTAHVLEGEIKDGYLEYTFSTPAKLGHIFNDVKPAPAGEVSTTKDWVWYLADVGDTGDEVVTLEVFHHVDGKKVSLGKATCKLTIEKSYVAKLEPVDPDVPAGGSVSFTVTVDPKPSAGKLIYAWTNVTPKAGHLTGGSTGSPDSFETTTPSATYKANTDAKVGDSDTISVEVLLEENGKRTSLDKASSKVTVADLYVLAGDAAGSAKIGADDNLKVTLNGTSVVDDNDCKASDWGPISLPKTAKQGDVIHIELWDCTDSVYMGIWSLGATYLVKSGQSALITPWVGTTTWVYGPGVPVKKFEIDFTIPF